ncbi:MAG: PepSY-associated TM helix domain-containing protein [Acidobacteria bacterium]|jgi:hypothetical protein|nr:PepSY-associated TM helix domain-containing protein [Acidobacteriota bacterium]
MNWRKWNNIIHRDLGYFLVGLTIIYAISGIAANHLRQWDSNFIIEKKSFNLKNITSDTHVDRALVDNILAQIGEGGKYKSHFRSSPTRLQIFLESGVVDVHMETGQVELENKRNRPVLREFNFLHLNHARKAWTWAADIYAVGLFLLAVTGLFILKGKNGLKGRGKWFVIAGILVPLVFLFLYFY